jgi:hypothetical protein
VGPSVEDEAATTRRLQTAEMPADASAAAAAAVAAASSVKAPRPASNTPPPCTAAAPASASVTLLAGTHALSAGCSTKPNGHAQPEPDATLT